MTAGKIEVKIERLVNWPTLLSRVIEASRNIPFTWEEQNCGLFPANVVEAMTGTDLAADYRSKMGSALAVRRLVKRRGGVANMYTQIFETFNVSPVAVSLAKRGDVVLAMTEQGHAGGICLGVDSAFPGPTGLVFLRTANCTHAFSI